MQYIEPLKLIFIHVPKTGGTFIENNLRLMNQKIFNNNKIFGGHHSYHKIKKTLDMLNMKDMSFWIIFSVVRDPYDRIVSAYNYLKQTEMRNNNDKNEWKYIGFPNSLTKFIHNIHNKYCNNELSFINPNNWHFQQQYKFVVNNFNEKKISCKLLKYENLDKDFLKFIELYKKFKKIYKFLYDNIYKKIKIKKKYGVTNILSSNEINMINEIYNNDFSLFRYNKINV